MSEAHWYVVHTYSGYENKVKVDIEKTIENRNLQDQILEVSVPMLPVVELKNGVEKKADKKMFPGYVLINMVMNDDTWYVVRNTRGVTGFVGPGSKPVPLTEEEMAKRAMKRTGFKNKELLSFMAATVCKIHEYLIEQDITDGVCGYRELENWVLSYMVSNDLRRSAWTALLSKASMDREEQETMERVFLLPHCDVD